MCRQIESATISHSGLTWRLKVWGIHQIGAERWVQMSASDQLHHHDLVVHLASDADPSDAVATLATWLRSPIPDGQIIHVR